MTLENLFFQLNDSEIPYVVSRKHEPLPSEVRDHDIDILVENENLTTFVNICAEEGFVESTSDSTRFARTRRFIRLSKSALSDPSLTASIFLNSPAQIPNILRGIPQENKRHRKISFRNGEFYLDVRNNLAYSSPKNRKRIPVDPAVTEGMFARRELHHGVYVPSPCDELAHIIPHCVFDKEGVFSEYYVSRCAELFQTVSDDSHQHETFKKNLDLIFYDASDLVYDLVARGKYSEILGQLYKFSDY